jgi:hypothetical protein
MLAVGPSISPAPEFASDLQNDPNPRSPKRPRVSPEPTTGPSNDLQAPIPAQVNQPSNLSQQPNHQPMIKSETAPVQHEAAKDAPQYSPPKPPIAGDHASGAPTPQHAVSIPPQPQASNAFQPTNALTQQTHASPATQAVPASSQGQIPKPPLQTSPSTTSTAIKPNEAASTTNSSNQPVMPPATAVPSAPRPDPQAEIARARIASLSSLRDLADQILRLLTKMPVVDALALDSDMRLLASNQQTATAAPAEYQRL